MADIFDTIIIGSGPAGYTAAIYASRGNLNTLLFKGTQPGGQLTTTTVIENWPGFEDGIDGNELMMTLEKQAKRFGAEMKSDTVSSVDFSGDVKKVFVGETEYQAHTVIIATGARSRKLGAPGEEEFFAKGVSTCATCDGFFFKGKDVMVVGGGDTAMEEASFLTNFCNSVTLINRSENFRASAIMLERVKNNPKVQFATNAKIAEYKGGDHLDRVVLEDTESGETREQETSAVFLAIGHIPNTEIFEGHIELQENKYIKGFEHMQTSVKGVYYAGDCQDHRYRQAIVASGDGCRAAMEAIKHVESLND